MVGYTPQIAAAVWVGNEKRRKPIKLTRTAATSAVATLPGEIWKRFMNAALKGQDKLGLPAERRRRRRPERRQRQRAAAAAAAAEPRPAGQPAEPAACRAPATGGNPAATGGGNPGGNNGGRRQRRRQRRSAADGGCRACHRRPGTDPAPRDD